MSIPNIDVPDVHKIIIQSNMKLIRVIKFTNCMK